MSLLYLMFEYYGYGGRPGDEASLGYLAVPFDGLFVYEDFHMGIRSEQRKCYAVMNG